MARTSNSDNDIKKLLREKQNLIEEKECVEIILVTQNTGLALINPGMTVSWVNDKLRELLFWDDPIGNKCYAFAESRTEPCEGCQAVLTFPGTCAQIGEVGRVKQGEFNPGGCCTAP